LFLEETDRRGCLVAAEEEEAVADCGVGEDAVVVAAATDAAVGDMSDVGAGNMGVMDCAR
jgi:hypothetical protein